MEKQYEEKLWDWLIKNFPEKIDAKRIFDKETISHLKELLVTLKR